MKHKIYIFTLAAALLTGCASDEFTGRKANPDGEVAITFSSGANGLTRADKTGADAATLLGNNFVVEGVKGVKSDGGDYDYADAQVVFDHYNVNWSTNTAGSTESNSSNWEYVGQSVSTNPAPVNAQMQTIKFWDFGADQYDFVAVSKGTGNATFSQIDYANIGNDTDEEPVYTVTGSVSDIMKAYVSNLLTIQQANYGVAPVTPKFRNLSAKVRLAIYETIPGYSVKNVEFYVDGTSNASTVTQTNAILYTTGSDKLVSGTASGVMNVFYPDPTGKKPLVTFDLSTGTDNTTTKLDFGKTLTYKGAEADEAAGNIYLGRSSNDASFAGKSEDATDYITVMPTGQQHALTLRVKYTLVSLDGRGETISVGPMSAVIPAEFTEWQPNYAYTYLFKITDEGSGLYPISFDAVDMIDYAPQESTTENSKPNITTYQNGVNVTENDEYLSGKNIYVTVGDLLTLEADGVTLRLFTATVEDGAVQGIDELSVANCFSNGTYDATAKTYTVTDINGKKLVLTDVTETKFEIVSTIPASDWKDGQSITRNKAFGRIESPDPNTVYVFQYVGADGLQLAEYNTLSTGAKYYFDENAGIVDDDPDDLYYKWNVQKPADGTETYSEKQYIKDPNLGKAYTYAYETETDELQPITPYLTRGAANCWIKEGNIFKPITPEGNEDVSTGMYYHATGNAHYYTKGETIISGLYYYSISGNDFVEHIANEDIIVDSDKKYWFFSIKEDPTEEDKNKKESYFVTIPYSECKNLCYGKYYLRAYTGSSGDYFYVVFYQATDGDDDATDLYYDYDDERWYGPDYDFYACPNSDPDDYHPTFYQESDFNTLKKGEQYEDEYGKPYKAIGNETLDVKKVYVKGSSPSYAYKVIKVK